MILLTAGIVICTWGAVTADLTDMYKKEGIIPIVYDEAPESLLQFSYNGKNVQFAQELTPREVLEVPILEWKFDPSSLYTFIINDPDVLTREDPLLGECVHWMVINIPGDDFNKGETIIEYMPIGPFKDSGIHRYVFSVYKQPGKLSVDEKYIERYEPDGRLQWSLRKFAKKHNLGIPIAGSMFTGQYDDSVPALHAKMGVQPEQFA